MAAAPLPLEGMVVLDLSRMLPGAVLVRQLRELGARVIKVEEPARGDWMRLAPPLVEGVGAGFAAFFGGVESVSLDLRRPEGAAAVRAIARRADVVIESFRPGTLEAWGLGYERLAGAHPGLVMCSLPGYGRRGDRAGRVGHDLNFVAEAGLLGLLPGGGLPRVQLADVSAGLLAATSVLAALLARARHGRGCHVESPLALGPLPLLSWAMADAAAGAAGWPESVLAGEAPSYRIYACSDGEAIAVAAIEPKFWQVVLGWLGLEHLAGLGLATGPEGEQAAAQVAAAFARAPRGHWLALAEREQVPVSAVQSLAEALADPYLRAQPGWLPSWEAPRGAAPRLGAHTAAVLAEFAAEVQP